MMCNCQATYDVLLFSDVPINGYFLVIEDDILRKYQKRNIDDATTIDTGRKQVKGFNLYDEVWVEKHHSNFQLNY
jgi:hypothetical protein